MRTSTSRFSFVNGANLREQDLHGRMIQHFTGGVHVIDMHGAERPDSEGVYEAFGISIKQMQSGAGFGIVK